PCWKRLRGVSSAPFRQAYLPRATPPRSMRPGLVAVGAILIVLGSAGIYAAVTAPSGTGETATHRILVGLPGLSTARAFGWGMNGSASVLVVSWQASGPINVTLS